MFVAVITMAAIALVAITFTTTTKDGPSTHVVSALTSISGRDGRALSSTTLDDMRSESSSGSNDAKSQQAAVDLVHHSATNSTRRRVFNMINFNNEELQTLTRFYELRDVVDYFVVGITLKGVMKDDTKSFSPHAMLTDVARKANIASKVFVVNISFESITSPTFFDQLPPKEQEILRAAPASIKWYREALMRTEMMRGFDDLGGTDRDLILLGDADELPDADITREVVAGWGTKYGEQDDSRCHIFMFDTNVHFIASLSCPIYYRVSGSWAVTKLLTGKTARTFGLGSFRGPCKSFGMYANCSRYSDTYIGRSWCSKLFSERVCQWHMSWVSRFTATSVCILRVT